MSSTIVYTKNENNITEFPKTSRIAYNEKALSMPSPEIVAHVCQTKNRVIGDHRGSLFNIPADLKRLKKLTINCPVIMGRKTWETLKRPLGYRANIVLTRDTNWTDSGAIPAHDVDHAIKIANEWIGYDPEKRNNRIIIFGGGEIYKLFITKCNVIEMTEVDFDLDLTETSVQFTELNSNWTEVSRDKLDLGPAMPTYPNCETVRFERNTLTKC